jgi:thiamine-phosphate diphosphorylase
MLIYVITDCRLRPDLDPLDLMEQVARSGADMMQVREKDLDAASLMSLARRAVGVAGAPVYVNRRADVAVAAGAVGVHLPADGLPVGDVASRWPGLRRGRSTHSRQEAMAAEAAGAHFITCGPVFDTPSKRPFGPPLGLRVLRETAEAVRVPVIAIGGIHAGNVGQVAALPIAGVAMISAVITAPDMMSAVARVREAAA